MILLQNVSLFISCTSDYNLIVFRKVEKNQRKKENNILIFSRENVQTEVLTVSVDVTPQDKR